MCACFEMISAKNPSVSKLTGMLIGVVYPVEHAKEKSRHINMKATKELTPQYQLYKTIDFKERKIHILLQILVIPLLILYLILFFYIAYRLQPTLFDEISFERPLLAIVIGLILMGLQIILHELLHGVVIWHYTKAKPTIGFSWTYAFAGAPDWYLPRNQFFLVTLAPFVVITFFGVLFLAIASVPVVMGLLLILVLNAAGSIGDHYVAFQLLREPHTTLCNDTGPKITFYRQGYVAPAPEL